MKAYRLVQPGVMAFEEIPVPQPVPGHALLKTLACGVCGTDLHLKNRGHYDWRGNSITLGHEVCAEVLEIPEPAEPNPRAIQTGDRVVIDPQYVCGACRWCRRGRLNLCDHLEHLGIMMDGGFQEYITAPLLNLYRVELEPDYASLAEPLATCVAAMKLAPPVPEDCVLVVGLGFFGQTFMQLARLWGAKTVIGLDPLVERREIAMNLGASAALDPEDPETPNFIKQQTGGLGASVVFDAAGSQSAPADCIRYAGKAGRVVVFGYYPGANELFWHEILAKELTVLGSKSSNHAWELTVQLLTEHALDLQPLTRVYDFDDAPEAFRAAEQREVFKPVLNLLEMPKT